MLVMPFLLQPFVFPDQVVNPPTKCHARATAVVSTVFLAKVSHLKKGFVPSGHVARVIVATPLAVRQFATCVVVPFCRHLCLHVVSERDRAFRP